MVHCLHVLTINATVVLIQHLTHQDGCFETRHFFTQVDETVKASLQIVLENVDHNWNLVYEDGDMKVQTFFQLSLYNFIEMGRV